FGGNSREVAKTLYGLSILLFDLNHDLVGAEQCLREALRICRDGQYEDLAADVLSYLGSVLRERRHFAESLEALRESLEFHRNHDREDSYATSHPWFGIAN